MGIGRPGGPRHGVKIMRRVIAIAACGFSLTGCSSWMPSFDLGFGGSSPGSLVAIAVESDPPGAEARASGGGQSCRTPCTLSVAATGPFTVNVALNGYVPQTVPVQLVRPDDPRLGSNDGDSGAVRVDPNPIYVELERAPTPAPPAKKRQAPKRAATAFAPASVRAPTTAAGSNAAPAAAPAPQPMQSAPPPSSTTAPWPMPR